MFLDNMFTEERAQLIVLSSFLRNPLFKSCFGILVWPSLHSKKYKLKGPSEANPEVHRGTLGSFKGGCASYARRSFTCMEGASWGLFGMQISSAQYRRVLHP